MGGLISQAHFPRAMTVEKNVVHLLLLETCKHFSVAATRGEIDLKPGGFRLQSEPEKCQGSKALEPDVQRLEQATPGEPLVSTMPSGAQEGGQHGLAAP